MAIPLEDNVSDVVGKAQRGLGISESQLAERAGVSVDAVRKIRGGDLAGEEIGRVAPVLKLNAAALRKLAAGEWNPEAIADLDGLAMFNTTYGDMTVNAYLVWDPGTRDAVAFDTGADCSAMLKRVAGDHLIVRM
ncbi:MAG TPA: MBL fold metallo-hydrolase, partial [Chthoniobacterales bacterium]|nr:MBL fold metallo-hydrolase [Chthoniobacterales bacterium]